MTPKKPASRTRTPRITADSTDVSGYFNQNNWPVNISVSALGRTFVVPPGAFLADSEGRKINDPLFEEYVGEMQLSREWSGNLVIINRVAPASVTPPSTNSSPVSEASSFKRDRLGNVSGATIRPAQASPPGNRTSPVIGMTIDAARRAGLIRPTAVPNEDAPEDGAGAPLHGAQLPTIDFAHDIGANAAAAAARQTVPQPLQRSSQPASLDEVAEVTQRFAQTIAAEPVPHAHITAASAAPAVQAHQPTQVIVHPPTGALPQPDIDGVSAETEAPAAGEPKFVCAADDRKFHYRSHLERHVKRKYPARHEELMAKYPKSGAVSSSPAAESSTA